MTTMPITATQFDELVSHGADLGVYFEDVDQKFDSMEDLLAFCEQDSAAVKAVAKARSKRARKHDFEKLTHKTRVKRHLFKEALAAKLRHQHETTHPLLGAIEDAVHSASGLPHRGLEIPRILQEFQRERG